SVPCLVHLTRLCSGGGYLGRDSSIEALSLIVGQGTHRGTQVGGYRHTAKAEHVLHGGDEGTATRLHGTAQGLESGFAGSIRMVQDGANCFWEGSRKAGDGTHRAGRERARDEGLLANEDRQVEAQIGLDP